MVLSASTVFAATEDVALNEVNDGIDIDEGILTTQDDTTVAEVDDESDLQAEDASNEDLISAGGNVVTNETYSNFINESGYIISDEKELIFEGDFSNVSAKCITVNKEIKLTGRNAIFNGFSFIIESNNVAIDGFSFTGSDVFLVSAEDVSNITLSNNKINWTTAKGVDSYAIYAYNVEDFKLLNNTIYFVGNTNGTVKNNVVRILGDKSNNSPSKNIRMEGNNFTINIPSIEVNYLPPTYEATIFSEGILIDFCDDLKFVDNRVNLKYNSFDLGLNGYDTVYTVSVRSDNGVSKNILIKNNEINVLGHNDTYAIVISAENYEISNNTIDVTAEVYCSHGISIINPSLNGNIKDNTIGVKAKDAAYGINDYGETITGMIYKNNKITADAYASCGIEIVENNPYVEDNVIVSTGNNTYGIVISITSNGTVINNNITSTGSNVGMVGIGDGLIYANCSMAVSVKGDALIKGNKIVSNDIGINALLDGDMVIDQNDIKVVANNDVVANYAVTVNGITKVSISNNNITFVGLTDGFTISNALYVMDTNNTVIKKNKFDLSLGSYEVQWFEIPPGSQNWVSLAVSEGIVIDSSNNAVFEDNTIVSVYNNVGHAGYYGPSDTIYVVDFKDSNNATIKGNNINATGYTYIYAISISGNDLNICGNDINVKANSHYAAGIEVKGSGEIENNNISTVAPNIAYGVIPGMTPVSINIKATGNNISGDAYYACGISFAGEKLEAERNIILVNGNYTVGINCDATELTANKNIISSEGSNIGNMSLIGIETLTTGINVINGNFTISNNDIETTGDYAAILGDNNGTVTDNQLLSNNGAGDDAIIGLGNVNTSGNPATNNKYIKIVLFANDLTKVYGSDDQLIVKILDENGKAVGNKTIKLVVDDEIYLTTSDADGVAAFDIDFVKGEYLASAKFDGDNIYGHKSITSIITVNAKPTSIDAPDKSVLLTEVKKGLNYKIILKDNSGNVLASQKVTINGKEYTTDGNGVVNYKLSASKAETQKLTVSFTGDDKYAESSTTATIKITKESTKLVAAKKTFKAKAKSKKYTVTLKDSKGKAIKGAKLIIKVKGKTYKATTKANGKATFNLKKLTKKGKHTAKVTFAGNNLYNKVTKSVKITVK